MFQLGAGLFATDNSLSTWGQIGQLASRFTWELPQTLSGQGLAQLSNTIGVVENVETFRGATVVASGISNRGAYTLGNVITGPVGMRGDFRDHLFVHEFGHVLQSRRMGPAYFFGVAYPSFADATFEDIGDWIGLDLGNHDERWYEARASRRAADYFDREFGAGQPGYIFRDPNFFDRQSYVNQGPSPYQNPRNLQFNIGANPIDSRFHWTDIPYSLTFNVGLGLLGHL